MKMMMIFDDDDVSCSYLVHYIDASNMLHVPVHSKQMCLYCQSKDVVA